MILHIVHDEKVTKRLISLFKEGKPGENIFISVNHNKNITYSDDTDIDIVYREGIKFECDFSEVKHVIIHYLTYKKVEFCNKFIPRDIPITWMVWGADLYNQFLVYRGFKLCYNQNRSLKFVFKQMLGRAGVWWGKNRIILNFIRNRVKTIYAEKCDCVLFNKYMYKYISHVNFESSFFYYPYDDVINKDLLNKRAEGNYILVGNSASYTNNHEYTLNYLKKVDLSEYRIVIPMSYGGDPSYKKRISDMYYSAFSDNVEILFDFLPLNQYNRLLLSSPICIFSNWRQEGWGNILTALYLGAKIYMSKHSVLFQYLKNRGLHIFTIEEEIFNLNDKLSDYQIKENRQYIIDNFSKKKLMNTLKINWN